jgi:hypothetical protein
VDTQPGRGLLKSFDRMVGLYTSIDRMRGFYEGMERTADLFKTMDRTAERVNTLARGEEISQKLLRYLGPLKPLDLPAFRMPENPLVTHAKGALASEVHKNLVEEINEFNDSLDAEHEIGVRLVSFSPEVTFHLTAIGYRNPSLIFLYGQMDDGSPVRVLRHVSQIDILLTKVRLTGRKRPIGFHGEEADDR